MLLFVSACVRGGSRNKQLADCLLLAIGSPVTEVRLADCVFPAADEAFLLKRDRLIGEGRFDDPLFALAGQFARADEIVVAAPFWDLSFPAVLKTYLEQINVVGITFRYTAEGVPEGLCRADRLIYVTTAGGEFLPESYGFGYVKALAQNFYGIRNVELIRAAGLDIEGADAERILLDAEEEIVRRFGPKE